MNDTQTKGNDRLPGTGTCEDCGKPWEVQYQGANLCHSHRDERVAMATARYRVGDRIDVPGIGSGTIYDVGYAGHATDVNESAEGMVYRVAYYVDMDNGGDTPSGRDVVYEDTDGNLSICL